MTTRDPRSRVPSSPPAARGYVRDPTQSVSLDLDAALADPGEHPSLALGTHEPGSEARAKLAGDPLNGGGFVILNGVHFDSTRKVVGMKNPYPGSNLFSLASGGAIYVRDPYPKVVAEQLNGGRIVELSTADWRLIRPYLEENERLFGISVTADLLTVGRTLKKPQDVYRKVMPTQLAVVTEVEDD